MVNGKPTLTFGGGVAPGSPQAQQRSARFNRMMDSFASYLPKESTPAAQAPVAQPPAAQAPTAQTSRAAAPRSAGREGTARLYTGHLPDNYLGSGRGYALAGKGQAALPAGRQSRAQARELARPAGGNTGYPAAQLSAAQSQRVPAKSSPRISNQPITGRGGIGMVDTRRAGAGGSTLAGRGALNYASPTANAARAQSFSPPTQIQGQQVQVAERGRVDHYARFASRFGTDHSGQSFLAHGFSGKNAETALRKMGYDMREARNLDTYARRLEPDPYALKNLDYVPPGTAVGSTRPVKFASGEDAARTAVQVQSHKKKADALPQGAYPARSLVNTFYSKADQGLGALAAKFESGEEGIAAIGYDRKGGTSYGKYQIASRPGTMNSFIDYLRGKAPDIAQRLASAGPANTGGRSGKMPAEWRKIASEDPERFENLQSDFIRTSHFEPAMQAIEVATGVSFDKLPTALQEVLFSTAVQHGPAGATRIVSQALRNVDAEKLQSGKGKSSRKTEEQLIAKIYNLRAGQFVSSTSRVQSAVRNRLKQEMREAMQMLA